MNLFEKIFKKSSQKTSVNQFEMLTGYKAVFTSYDGGIYESELCRSAINTIATHCSKLTPEVVGNDKDVYKVITKPNEFMTASQFLYRAATILNTQNTCFIVPMEDKYGEINGLFPILPSECEVVYDDYNQLWLNYRFSGGKRGIIELDRVGVLKKHYYKNDVFGENNEALRPTMQLIKTQQTGIEEGIKSSANYTFMASMANFASDPDIAKAKETFNKNNFNGEGGMLLMPGEYTNVQQIKPTPFIVPAAQIIAIQNNVFNYFGVNEDVIQNKCVGDKWAAFYEGVVEPFAIQLSECISGMFYNRIDTENKVMYTANRLQYMTNNEKLATSSNMFDRGLMSRNEIREIWNLKPIVGGDAFTVRGEYYTIDENGNKVKTEEKKNDK